VVGGSFEFKDSGGNDAEVSLAANTTDDLAEGTTNLYAAQAVGTTDDVTFNSVTVDGDLTVNGTTTTLNTTTLDVEDINITVANGAADATAADGAGLTIDLGTDGTADFTYDSGNDRLASNKSIAADLVGDVTGTVSDISNHDTDDLAEGTTNLYYTDSRVRNAVSAGTGLDYSSAAGEFSLADTAVTAGSFGSASEVPVITVDAQGRITSASTTNVAGVSSFLYDNATGDLDIGTADGSTFTATVALGPFTTDDLSEGTNLYYTDARVDSHLSGGTGVGFNAGVISIGQSVGTTDNVTFNTVTSDVTGNVTGTVSDISNHDTDDLSEGTTNLYYTDARVDAHLSGGTGVSFSNGTISIGQSVDTTDNVTFNDLTVSGDLTVTGTTTSLDTTTLNVEDINVTVANGATSAAAANGAGLTADLGSDGSATFTYDSANDRWSMNKSLNTDLIGNVTGDVTGTVSDISNHDTDDLLEGTSNLYYTDTRVRNAVSASGDLSYNSTTGAFSFTERTDAEVRGLLSAAGDLSYNSTTGEFSVTTFKSSDFDSNFSGKSTTDLSEGTNLYYTDARVDAHLSGGSGIDFSTGTISHSDTSSVGDVTASSNTFVDSLTFDEFGHVTAVSTTTAAPPNDATITVSPGTGLSGGGNFTTDQSINETISLDVDTSTIATRSYVDTEVANLVDSSPETLDTLNELAAALGDDPNFATTVANDIGTKADKTTDINAGSGLAGGGDLSADRTISHADTSSQSSINNSGNTVIQDITLDGFGHITGLSSKTIDPPTLDTLGLDTNDDVQFDSLGIGTTASGTSGEIRATNDITAFFSDERLKDFIGPIDGAVDKINKIGGYYFTENQTAKDLGYNNQGTQVGVNAQEIQKVLPEVVKTAPISYNEGVEEEYLTVQYEKMVPLLIEAIKEQQEQIEDLKIQLSHK